MNKENKIIVAGHICIDITPIFPYEKLNDINKVLKPGHLTEVKGVNIHTGGVVANTGIAMKLLGGNVKLIGKIGKDDFGELILNRLKEYNIDGEMVVSEKVDTSYSIVLAIPNTDRIFLHNPGANDTFEFEDLNFNEVKEAKLFHFGYPPLMKKMYIDNGKELKKILEKVKESGTITSVDMAAIDSQSDAAKANWSEILSNILPYVDFFVPSVEELCFMLDRKLYNKWIEKAKGREVTEILSYEDISPLGQKIIELGAKVVLIKCGALGMYYKTSKEEDMKNLCYKLNLDLDKWAELEGFEASYIPDKVVSGTGAGDTSIAAFLISVLENSSLNDALKMATATGACCVSSYDALSGLIPLDKLKEKIEKGWKKRKI